MTTRKIFTIQIKHVFCSKIEQYINIEKNHILIKENLLLMQEKSKKRYLAFFISSEINTSFERFVHAFGFLINKIFLRKSCIFKKSPTRDPRQPIYHNIYIYIYVFII